MSNRSDTRNMALFCDFENVALGVREARYPAFDIQKVLERLLLKGNIVVKKAYCDWERYKEFKGAMHEAAFELIEIPHVRQSGKNSADIRMVVDALDLCYTKSHVDTFVVISGDSDFSHWWGSCARTTRCDRRRREEVDLRSADRQLRRVHLLRRPGARGREGAQRASQGGRQGAGEGQRKAETKAEAKVPAEGKSESKSDEEKRQAAIDLVLETIQALFEERGDEEKVWGSMVKQALKAPQARLHESYHGFRTFGSCSRRRRSESCCSSNSTRSRAATSSAA